MEELELYWDEDGNRYVKYSEESDEYYTDDDTREATRNEMELAAGIETQGETVAQEENPTDSSTSPEKPKAADDTPEEVSKPPAVTTAGRVNPGEKEEAVNTSTFSRQRTSLSRSVGQKKAASPSATALPQASAQTSEPPKRLPTALHSSYSRVSASRATSSRSTATTAASPAVSIASAKTATATKASDPLKGMPSKAKGSRRFSTSSSSASSQPAAAASGSSAQSSSSSSASSTVAPRSAIPTPSRSSPESRPARPAAGGVASSPTAVGSSTTSHSSLPTRHHRGSDGSVPDHKSCDAEAAASAPLSPSDSVVLPPTSSVVSQEEEEPDASATPRAPSHPSPSPSQSAESRDSPSLLYKRLVEAQQQIKTLDRELHDSKKVISELQKKDTPQMSPVDRYATDNEELIRLRKERTDQVAQRQAVENELASMEAIIETKVTEKEMAEVQLEQIRQQVDEMQFQLDCERANMKATAARLESASDEAMERQKQVREALQNAEVAQRQREEYKLAFESLKTWHVQLMQKCNQREADVVALTEAIVTLKAELQTATRAAGGNHEALNEYERLISVDQKVIRCYRHSEQVLKEQLNAAHSEIRVYKQAWTTLGQTLEVRERQKLVEVEELQAKVAELEESLLQCQSLTAPRWQRLAMQQQTGISVTAAKASSVLCSRHNRLKADISTSMLHYVTSCLPDNAYSKEIEAFGMVLTAYRCIHKCLVLAQYIREAHLKEIVIDAAESMKTVGQERGFVRWCVSTVILASGIVSSLSQCIRRFFGCPLDMYFSLTAADSRLTSITNSGDRALDRLLEIAENDYLSAATDYAELETFWTQLAAFCESSLLGSETEMAKQRTRDTLAVDAVQISCYAIEALAVMGISGAACTNRAVEALDPQDWHQLLQTTETALKLFPAMPRTVQESLEFGPDVFVVSPSEKAIDEGLVQCQTEFQRILFSVDETKSQNDYKIGLGTALSKVTGHFETIRALAERHISKKKQCEVPPAFKVACEAVHTGLTSNVVEIERRLEDTHLRHGELEISLTKAEEEIKRCNASMESWRSKCTSLQLRAERCHVMEEESQTLRSQEKFYIEELNSYREQLHKAQDKEERLATEVDTLNRNLEEVRRHLEAAKVLYRDFSSNEHVAQERASLRSIVRKLEREIYALRVQDAEADMRELEDVFGDWEESVGRGQSTAAVSSSCANILDDYRSLQQAVWVHNFQLPIWDPFASRSENESRLKSYRSVHETLLSKMSLLESSAQEHLAQRLLRSTVSTSSSFGGHAAITVTRYLAPFLELADTIGGKKGLQDDTALKEGVFEKESVTSPAIRITLPRWAHPVNGHPEAVFPPLSKLVSVVSRRPHGGVDLSDYYCTATHSSAGDDVQLAPKSGLVGPSREQVKKLMVTELQLADLHGRIAGRC